MTLRRKLLLLFLGIAVAPIASVVTLLTWGALRFTEKQARATEAAQLDTLSTLIDRQLLAEESFLHSLATDLRSLGAAGSGRGPSDRLLGLVRAQSRLGQLPPFISRMLLLEAGRAEGLVIRGHLSPTEMGLQATRVPAVSLAESYRRILDGRGGPTEPPLVRTLWGATGPVVAIVVPLGPASEHPRQLLVEELSAVVLLEDLLAQPSFQTLETSFVAAPCGTGDAWSFLYHSDPTRIGLPAAQDSRVVPWPVHEGEWSFARSAGHVSAARVQPSTGWVLGGVLSLGPFLDPLRNAIQVSLLLFGLMTVLVVAAILLVTRGIGGVVEEIAASAGAIARGDLRRTLLLHRADEFGVIAQHVNQMARDLVLTAESRSVARLSTRLVHDLKGVASQLHLMLYNLKEHYDDPEFRRESLGLLQDLATQIESLALRLRRGGEESEPEWKAVDVNRVVEKLLDARVRPRWPTLLIARELRASREALADEDLLTEALENVLVNAGEAMEGRGTLTVRTGEIPRFAGAASGPRATHFVEVADTGPGMSREFVDRHLFQPFSTTKPKGIGLGMYQARQSVTRLGGRIEVRSREGEGARVRIELGRAEP